MLERLVRRATNSRRRRLIGSLAAIATLVVALASISTASAATPSRSSAVPAASHTPAAACKIATTNGNTYLTEGFPTDYDTHPRPDGVVHAVMLFVDFPDAKAYYPTFDFADYINLVATPAEQHYAQASYGHLHLKITPVRHWYRMPQPSTYYTNRYNQSISDALALADPHVNFAKYQIVYIVPYYTQAGLANSPTFTVPPQDGFPTNDGVRVHSVVRMGRDIFKFGRGHTVTVHESGHIFGLPDLYSFDSTDFDVFNRFVGGWDMQGWIEVDPDFMVWHKWKFGWVSDRQIACVDAPGTTTVRLQPEELDNNATKAAVVRVDAHTAYVVENREPIGLDKEQCTGGILIYKVDANVRTGDGPIRVQPARRPSASQSASCLQHSPRMSLPLAFAPYSLGKGQVSTFTDPANGLVISVTNKKHDDYTVRISYHPTAS